MLSLYSTGSHVYNVALYCHCKRILNAHCMNMNVTEGLNMKESSDSPLPPQARSAPTSMSSGVSPLNHCLFTLLLLLKLTAFVAAPAVAVESVLVAAAVVAVVVLVEGGCIPSSRTHAASSFLSCSSANRYSTSSSSPTVSCCSSTAHDR
jgi:hypothetical protein